MRSLIDICDLFPTMGLSAGFPQPMLGPVGSTKAKWSTKADVRFPNIPSPPIHQGGR